MAGINQVADVAIAIAELGNGIYNVSKDPGFGFDDVNDMLPFLLALPAAIEGYGEIPEQLKDMDEAEALELQEKFSSRFDIGNEDIEEFVEDSLSIAFTGAKKLSLWGYVDKWFLSGRIAK
jgi:hypothetical protein